MTESTTESMAPLPLEQFSDADLLDAWAQDRQPEAMATLVRRYSVMVLSVCRRKCRSPADVDDAYQTTFLYLAKKCGSIRRPECLPGWLHRVAQRVATATLVAGGKNDPLMDEPTIHEDPLSRISRQHEAMLLDEELAKLPEHYRSAIVLHLYDGLSLESLAVEQQTSVGSIRGRLQRGKKLLANRLRRRGLVPIIAFAAAGVTVVSESDAAAASEPLIKSLGGPSIPDPPIDPHLFEPFVSSGVKLMSRMNLLIGTATVGTVTALLCLSGPGERALAQEKQGTVVLQADADRSESISVPLEVAAAQYQPFAQAPTAPVVKPPQPAVGGKPQASRPQRMVWQKEYRPSESSSRVADQIRAAMDESYSLQIGKVFGQLAESLEGQLELPVMVNDRAVEFAKVDVQTPVNYIPRNEPLRTALRRILRPIGLKATIEDEGIVITADHSVLVHHDIGTDRWLNVDDATMRAAEEQLSKNVSFAFDETPLVEAVAMISEKIELPILIDRRALEEIGLDHETAITCDLKEISAKNFVSIMLRDLDLTLNVVDDVFHVTSREAVDQSLLTRVYFLEGLGIDGDFQSLMDMIQTTCSPDAWEAMGGGSTMAPMNNTRPALLVSTSYAIHQHIGKMLSAFRENSFQTDTEPNLVEVPADQVNSPAQTGSWMGGGMGGGMM